MASRRFGWAVWRFGRAGEQSNWREAGKVGGVGVGGGWGGVEEEVETGETAQPSIDSREAGKGRRFQFAASIGNAKWNDPKKLFPTPGLVVIPYLWRTSWNPKHPLTNRAFPKNYCGWTNSCTKLKPRETLVGWYLQGNQDYQVSQVVQDFATIHSISSES